MSFYFSPFTLINQYQPYFNLNPSNIFSFQPFYKTQNESTTQIVLEKLSEPNFELQNESKEPINRKIVKKSPKKYNKVQDKNFGFRDQDKQRNILSNILKAFLSVLLQKRQMNHLVINSLQLIKTQMLIQDFYVQAQNIFKDVKSYLSPKTMKQKLFGQDSQDSCKKVLRMVLMHFLKMQFSISLLRSSRVKRKSKLLQMKKVRYLRSLIQ